MFGLYLAYFQGHCTVTSNAADFMTLQLPCMGPDLDLDQEPVTSEKPLSATALRKAVIAKTYLLFVVFVPLKDQKGTNPQKDLAYRCIAAVFVY